MKPRQGWGTQAFGLSVGMTILCDWRKRGAIWGGRAISQSMANSSIDPRYPVGSAPRAESVDAAQISHYIAGLAALPENLRSAVDGLSEVQLDTPYRDGGWTVRQVVHHVADSHMQAYGRIRLALTEDWPVIKPYDEKLWAELADCRTLPVEVSLEILAPLHRRWVALLKSLSGADWERGYQHPERGRTSLAQAVALYEWHSRHHVAHIMELRKSKGW
jgi:hypothetical protein